MSRSSRLALALLATLPVSLQAAPKPTPTPTPSSFVPEVAYRYVGSAGYDLRLGSASGNAAILLHRSATPLYDFDLAPRSVQAAVVVERTATDTNRLVLRSWTQQANGGAITVAQARTLYETTNISYPDFSPDGTRVSFVQWDGGYGSAASYSIQLVELASGSVQTFASGLKEPYFPVWSMAGDAIYYASLQPVNGVNTYFATRHPVDGSSPTVMFAKARIGRWDISRDGFDKLIMTAGDSSEVSRAFSTWDGTALSQTYPQLIGSSPHYSCGNGKMIYISYTRGGARGPLKVFTPSAGTDVVYSKDQNANDADWIPC